MNYAYIDFGSTDSGSVYSAMGCQYQLMSRCCFQNETAIARCGGCGACPFVRSSQYEYVMNLPVVTMLVDLQDKSARRQEYVDRYYVLHGKCCAGCDWWRHINSVAGTCERHAPAVEGFPVTARGDVCGDFKDEFDWNSLPLAYRRKIGLVTTV